MNILMVCTGNICRSPMAEGIARDIATQTGKTSLIIDSAGTHGYHIGEPPHPLAQTIMRRHGHNIDALRARKITAQDVQQYDRIMVADEQHRTAVYALAPHAKHQHKIVKMLKLHPSLPDADLPDPYGNGEAAFEHVYQLLYSALKHYLAAL